MEDSAFRTFPKQNYQRIYLLDVGRGHLKITNGTGSSLDMWCHNTLSIVKSTHVWNSIETKDASMHARAQRLPIKKITAKDKLPGASISYWDNSL